MKQTHFETLTKANIEYDIKSLYKWKLQFIPCTIFAYIGIPIMWFCCGFSKGDTNIILITILILYLGISLYLTIYSVYYVIQYFSKNIGYTIVSDTFIKTGVYPITCGGPTSSITYLCFSKYGKYSLDMHRWYYQWSDLYCMKRNSIIDRAKPGDEFYLVIKNNKIINAYNKRMFQLKEQDVM